MCFACDGGKTSPIGAIACTATGGVIVVFRVPSSRAVFELLATKDGAKAATSPAVNVFVAKVAATVNAGGLFKIVAEVKSSVVMSSGVPGEATAVAVAPAIGGGGVAAAGGGTTVAVARLASGARCSSNLACYSQICRGWVEKFTDDGTPIYISLGQAVKTLFKPIEVGS